MVMVLLILQYLFIFILVLLAIVLFVPVAYYLDGTKEERYFFSFRISWLWRIFSIIVNKEENQELESYIVIFGLRFSIHSIGKRKKREKTKEIKKQEKTKKDYTKYLSLFQQFFLKELFVFIRRLLRHILPRKCRFHLIYGCSNAAHTGILSGIIAILIPYIKHNDIVLQPVFYEEVIRGELNLRGRMILAVILYYFLQFYFARGVRQVIKEIRTK